MLGEIIAKPGSRIPSGGLEVLTEMVNTTTPQFVRDLPDRLVRGRQQALGLLDPLPGLVDTEGTPDKANEAMGEVTLGNP